MAIIISMVIITAVYISVNIAYVVVLGVDGVISSQAVAMDFVAKTMGPITWIIAIMICINNCGSLNSGTLVGSR